MLKRWHRYQRFVLRERYRIHMDNTTSLSQELDVTVIAPRDKHPTIHRRLDALAVGESLVILNDHDPRPLRFEIEADHPGKHGWKYIEQGPETWRVEINRLP